MDEETFTAKLLKLVMGSETPESWNNWWNMHEEELQTLLNRTDFLKLKPRQHDFKWVPILTSQKGAISILKKNNITFEASTLYHNKYLEELDAFCEKQKQDQKERQKKFKTEYPEWFKHYPKFSMALSKSLTLYDEILPAATIEQIKYQEKILNTTIPFKVQKFFLLTAGINVSTGVIIILSNMFNLTIQKEQYCVLGEFWKEADGDLLLLRLGEEKIWYYAHEQNKIKLLCKDIDELLEKKLTDYLNNSMKV